MQNKRSSSIRIVIIGVILVGMVIGYYYYLSNRKPESTEETAVETSKVQEILLYNFERSYPPTPKEVVKLFGEITMCLYNETYSEEELLKLAAHIENLYDAELIANKTPSQYIEDLHWDVNQMKEKEIVVSSYAVSSSADVVYFEKDGYEWAKLYCSFTLRQGTALGVTDEIFVLRKDEEGHWKIYGWAEEEEGK